MTTGMRHARPVLRFPTHVLNTSALHSSSNGIASSAANSPAVGSFADGVNPCTMLQHQTPTVPAHNSQRVILSQKRPHPGAPAVGSSASF